MSTTAGENRLPSTRARPLADMIVGWLEPRRRCVSRPIRDPQQTTP